MKHFLTKLWNHAGSFRGDSGSSGFEQKVSTIGEIAMKFVRQNSKHVSYFIYKMNDFIITPRRTLHLVLISKCQHTERQKHWPQHLLAWLIKARYPADISV